MFLELLKLLDLLACKTPFRSILLSTLLYIFTYTKNEHILVFSLLFFNYNSGPAANGIDFVEINHGEFQVFPETTCTDNT